jgi:glycosyltransferase involved in cell wall biosynthesis
MTSRVLHLALSFARGGRRSAVTNLARALADEGHASDLACLDSLACPAEEVAGDFGRTLVLARRGALDPRAPRAIATFCGDRGIDVMHAHDAASLWAGALARVTNRAPSLVYTFHRTATLDTRGLVQRARNSLALTAARAVVVGSTDRQRYFMRTHWVKRQKVQRIPFGVDLSRFRPDAEARRRVRSEWGVAESELVLGCVGHFWPDKGVDVALRAYRALGDAWAGPMPPFVIVGEGSEARLRELSELGRACARGKVIFAGFRQDVEACLASLDVLVHTPRAEAFGLVLAEGAAVGLPVVATAVGGVTDIVRDERTGLLAPSGDVAGLVHAMSQLLSDHELRERLGANARQVAIAEYSMALFGKRHAALYSDVRAGRPPRGVD